MPREFKYGSDTINVHHSAINVPPPTCPTNRAEGVADGNQQTGRGYGAICWFVDPLRGAAAEGVHCACGWLTGVTRLGIVAS